MSRINYDEGSRYWKNSTSAVVSNLGFAYDVSLTTSRNFATQFCVIGPLADNVIDESNSYLIMLVTGICGIRGKLTKPVIHISSQ